VGFLDSVLSNSIGVAYRAYTGNVDPWTKANIVEDAQAGVTQALGPNASPIAVQQARDSAAQLVTASLLSDNADPSQSSAAPRILGSTDLLSLANLQTYVYGALIIGAVIAAVYVYRQFKK
jgi:hypothetical protein